MCLTVVVCQNINIFGCFELPIYRNSDPQSPVHCTASTFFPTYRFIAAVEFSLQYWCVLWLSLLHHYGWMQIDVQAE